MSVFSMIRKGHKAAKEHKDKKAEKERKEQEQVPYKHVPRHAAIDALGGGPAASRDLDRERIMEQNKRRSAMTAKGLGMSGMSTPVHTGMPRTNSSLSYVSYPSAFASPVVQMPRAYSYSGVNPSYPGWSHQGGDMSYQPPQNLAIPSMKGKEIEKAMRQSAPRSRSSSKGSNYQLSGERSGGDNKDGSLSPTNSSSGSTSSRDNLEMKPAKPSPSTSHEATASRGSRPASESPEYFHRLHPGSSHFRRTSEPVNNPSTYYPPKVRSQYPQYALRPGPPSRSSSNGSITREAAPPLPDYLGPPHSTTLPTYAITSTTPLSSLATMVPAATYHSLNTDNFAPPPMEMASPIVVRSDAVPGSGHAKSNPASSRASAAPIYPESQPQRPHDTTRFTELQTIDSHISNFSASLDFGFYDSKKTGRTTQAPVASPSGSEASSPRTPVDYHQTYAPAPSQKKGKLSKSTPRSAPPPSPSKPKATKNRWSFRSNKTAAVAV